MVQTYFFVKTVESIFKIIRLFIPPIVRAFMVLLSVILTGILTFWGGVPNRVKLLAEDWLEGAVSRGFPTVWAPQLYYIFWGLAFITIVAAWVILSAITLWLVNHIL